MIKISLRKLVVLVLSSMFLPQVVYGETQAQAPSPAVTVNTTTTPATPNSRLWNLQNADILSVINAISRETGKNFIVDPRVQGKVTIVSSKPMDADEIYQVFLAVLQTHGYAAVPNGNVIKIVPESEAKQQQTPLVDANNPGTGDELVVRVIPIKNIPADQLLPIIRPMLPQPSDASLYPPSNTIIISGHASKVNSIVAVIERIDTENHNNVEVVALHHATASDLVTEINSLQGNNRYSGNFTNINIVADDRTNSIIVSGDQSTRLRIRTLIAELDNNDAYATDQGSTQVIYLRYLKAKDLVPILRGVVGNGNSDLNTGSSDPTVGICNSNPPPGKDTDMIDEDSDKAKAPVYTDAPRYFIMGSQNKTLSHSTSSCSTSDKKVNIQAEPNTNAIIISAPPATMASLKSIISQLDVRPAQVLVEAIIVELDENKLEQLGVEWGTSSEAGSPTDGSQFSTLTGGLGIGFINRGDIRVLIRALGSDSTSNILATPSLVVLDNQKANIKVGKKVPTTTGSYPSNSAGSSVEPFTTTDYQDVVLQLNVTPQITRDNTVRLHIEQGNDTLASQTGANNNPIFNTALIKTDVMVKSNQILVLGGLINNDLEGNVTKVPVLSKIPLLGQLFKSKNNSLTKKNLVVFLRPVILLDDCDNKMVTTPRYNSIRKEQLKAMSDTPTNLGPKPLLPRLCPVNLPKPFNSHS